MKILIFALKGFYVQTFFLLHWTEELLANEQMQILDFVVIILFLWFLWETAHSLDFYCVIVYNNIVTNIQVFVAKAFLRSDIFLVHWSAIFDGVNQFFYTDICWPGLGIEVKDYRGCDIRSHGLDLPGTPWVVPHECHQVADTVEEVIWMKAKVPIVLDNPGWDHHLCLADDPVHRVPRLLMLQNWEEIAPGVQWSVPISILKHFAVAQVDEPLELVELWGDQ